MEHRARRIEYIPAIDGLRAIAVIAVVAFHAELGWASGGFLGVSIFFTLSGYLITSLLLAEYETEGRISLRNFFARRIRRLVPAAWLTIGVVVLGAFVWNDSQLQRLRGDAWAALGNVANWRFAAADISYSDLFVDAQSPLAHFWSLAIEEQFYVVFPIIAVVALRLGGQRGLTIAAGTLFIAASGAAVLTSDFDLAYNGTHTRAAELLTGVLVAIALSAHGKSLAAHANVATRRVWSQRVAASGLAFTVAAVVVFDLSDQWLAHGGFVAFSFVSAAIIVGVQHQGRVSALLSWRPFVAIGKVSYGIYLFHWPLFLVLSPDRVGLSGPSLLAVRLVALGALTTVSYGLLEQPVRHRRLFSTVPRASIAAFGAAGVVVVASFAAVTPTAPSLTGELLAQGSKGIIEFRAEPETVPAVAAHAAVLDLDPLASTVASTVATTVATTTVLVIGSDPRAVDELQPFADDRWTIVDGVQRGCPTGAGLEARLETGEIITLADCESTATRLRRLVVQFKPSLVILSLGPLDESLIRSRFDIGYPDSTNIAEIGARQARSERVISTAVTRLQDAGINSAIAWWGDDGGGVKAALDRITIAEENLPPVITTGEGLVELVERQDNPQRASDPASPRRVVVFGDSTSLTFARALHEADAGFDVLWAGENGCPIVAAVALRPAAAGAITPIECDGFAVKLAPLFESFRPDFAILVAGPIELAEQFYTDETEGHLPGSARYAEVHDDALRELGTLFSSRGVPLYIADAPPIHKGSFATREMTDPARLAAWNEIIERFDATDDNVKVFGYAGALLAYEERFGSIRPDGVHPDVEPLTELLASTLDDWLIS